MVAYLHAPEKVAGSTPARALFCVFFFIIKKKKDQEKRVVDACAHTHTHIHKTFECHGARLLVLWEN